MYGRFAAALVGSLVAMYALAFSQIDLVAHFEWSLSVPWISLSMIAAMGLIMLTAMLDMLPDARVNRALYAGFGLLFVFAIVASRLELLVGDDAFLRSMIPHHSRAIHMCQEAEITDPEIIELCDGIIETQLEEIREMDAIMERRG